MAEREKVIKGLECCTAPGRNCDMRCPYYDEDECEARLERDALILLKEQSNCENCAMAIEDRQPVIRCKDCKNAEPAFDGKMARCKIRGLRKNDWFCADGKRKESK